MGSREIGDSSTMVNSSIAILQERFKQLQRVKEKRQEKELLKLFSESSERHTATLPPTPSSSSSSSSSSSKHFEQYSRASSIQTPRIPLSSPSLLSLGLINSSLESKQRYYSYDHRSFPTRNDQTSFWSGGDSSPKTAFKQSDVDTSLHL